MSQHQNNNGTILGTIGGTLLSVFANVHAGDIVKTIVLATVGALVSFGVSLLLKKAVRFISK